MDDNEHKFVKLPDVDTLTLRLNNVEEKISVISDHVLKFIAHIANQELHAEGIALAWILVMNRSNAALLITTHVFRKYIDVLFADDPSFAAEIIAAFEQMKSL